jgi:hypothetical protein
MLSDTEASCLAIHSTGCVLEKEEAQMDEGVVKKSEMSTPLKDIRSSEPSDFQNFVRLDATSYDELLKMIMPRIKKKYYHARCYSYKPASIFFLKVVRKDLSFLINYILSASGNLSLYLRSRCSYCSILLL